MAESSAALSLRESFGDRKLPDITRKITACVACRKQKIKCHMNEPGPCKRCKARGLPCTVNKSLQMILENDAGWKETIEERMRKLEEKLLSRSNQQEILASLTPESQTSPVAFSETNTNTNLPFFQGHSESASDVTLNLSCNLGSFPGSSIITLTFTEPDPQSSHNPDLISSGLITLEAAEEYFSIYQNQMEPCVYQILAPTDCLANVRARSSLLTSAICTVGSFCADSAIHKRCYDAFIKEVSSRLFSRKHSFDDVRALCIGAFWLNKVSSTLVGLAVRMANDLNLHRCITKMPHVKTECYERTRLYFIVYVCDHHCSLPYGRPSMTPEFHTLKPAKSFLQSKFCTSSDVKLISQVELWSVSSKVFDIFGADVEASVTEGREKELDLLGRSFDLCMSSDTALNSTADVFWERLSELHIHCAKLSLFSHIFRGSAQRHGRSPSTPFHGMEKFERSSLESALAIVRAVAWGEEIQKRLAILPSYFGTMIAFASITLIKAWGKEPTMCYLDKNEVSTTLNRLVEVFQACAGRIQSEHPLRSVARSLKIALNGSCCHMEEIHGSMGFMPNAIDNAVFDFGDFGNGGLGMDYVGDQNNSLAYTGDFHSSLFGM